MSDGLARATRALKQARRGHHDDSERTRRRVIETLHQRDRHKRRSLILVPLAALLIGTSALAHDRIRQGRAPASEVEMGAVTMVARAVIPASLALESVVGTPDGREPGEDAARPGPTGTGSTTRAPTHALDHAAEADSTRATDRQQALYRRAHDAHFGGASRATALKHWNAYLSEAPGGSFAPEAAFNRGICLVRLGRHAQARQALAPFASGRFGGYRKQEAERLMEALRQK
jgi:hypothetical protein